MNNLVKCLGYVTLSNLLLRHSVVSIKSRDLKMLNNFNVTLKSHPYSMPSYYRFPKDKFPEQYYDAILALDFEASIARIFTTITEQEIIEFPCVWIDTKTMKPIKTFHRYVRPVLHPVLDPLCTSLTGITTEMLRGEKPFTEVLQEFKSWYSDMRETTKAEKIVFVTCGDWDLKVMMPSQCRLSHVSMPNYMRHWINVKESFTEVTNKYPRNLKEMITLLNVKKVGKLHRGLDDTLNVVNIVIELAKQGHVFVK